jgi:cytochrome c6
LRTTPLQIPANNVTNTALLVMRLLLSVALALLCGLVLPLSASAADAALGAKVFSANCAACHAGGGNIVNGERTLKQADLQNYLAQYSNGHESAIVAQVTYGRNAMPAFIDTLTENQISDVAAYVEEQASKGWS